MRVLWFINYPVPSVAKEAGMAISNRGGWLNELSRDLAQNHTLGVAFPIEQTKQYKDGHCNSISYYALPVDVDVLSPDTEPIAMYENVIQKFNPDVVHIWGTEYMHTFYAVMSICTSTINLFQSLHFFIFYNITTF